MKCFGIGPPRTGTKSLNEALCWLGIRSVHYPIDDRTCREVVSGEPYSILNTHDGLTDLHAMVRFKSLDRRHPGSKFILTVREREAWVNSNMSWFSWIKMEDMPEPERSACARLRVQAWGSVDLSRERLLAAYDRHVADVENHFCQRPADLLIMNVFAGDGWRKLCPFLGKPFPAVPFPHLK